MLKNYKLKSKEPPVYPTRIQCKDIFYNILSLGVCLSRRVASATQNSQVHKTEYRRTSVHHTKQIIQENGTKTRWRARNVATVNRVRSEHSRGGKEGLVKGAWQGWEEKDRGREGREGRSDSQLKF